MKKQNTPGGGRTIREEMMSGRLYDATDGSLLGELYRAQEMCQDYNALRITDFEGRRALLEKLLGKAGKNLIINPPFFCDYGSNIELGDDVFINAYCVILDEAKVKFGNHVFVAPQCGFYTAGHPLDKELRRNKLEYSLPITVGDDVWIGGMVAVMPGVTIGSGSVIGGGSVVVNDIPEGVLAAGNPCRVIRKISPEDRDRYRR
jgi:acetyltransferase-like isoleucine patch superfamily enzyme